MINRDGILGLFFCDIVHERVNAFQMQNLFVFIISETIVMKLKIFFNILILLAVSNAAQAALIDRGRGMIYDDYLDITWLQDVNYAKTSGYTAINEVDAAYGGDPVIIRKWGGMSFTAANQWAENLIYEGYDDWRLPTYRPDLNLIYLFYSSEILYQTEEEYYADLPGSEPYVYIYHGVDSRNELEFMQYWNLGNKPNTGVTFYGGRDNTYDYPCESDCLVNDGGFTNLLNTAGFWTNVPAGEAGGGI